MTCRLYCRHLPSHNYAHSSTRSHGVYLAIIKYFYVCQGQLNSDSVTVKIEPDFDFDGMTTDINMNNQSSGLVVAGVTGNATIDLPPSPSDLDIEYQGQTGVVIPLVKLETSHSSDSEQLSLTVSEVSETESKQAS